MSGRTGEPLLQVEDLRVHFHTPSGIARVVDGANLTVARNEVFGIAGESGCGKTTLVEAILQIIRFPNRLMTGKVRYFPEGKKPIDLVGLGPGEMRRVRGEHISYVPQGSMNSLNPVMRIGNQIVDAMTTHGISAQEAKRRVPDLLAKVGLEPRVAQLRPHELSGGMKQRVIIAIAISLGPDLIVADEPTTALDVNVQRFILETLVDLRRDLGVAIMIVSHDLPVHAQLVDRLGVMYAGQVVESGPVRPVLKAPLHPYTQGLMAAIPAIGGEQHRLSGIEGSSPSPLAWPEGCRFHPRCPKAMEMCSRAEPRLAEIEADRLAACHLYPESSPLTPPAPLPPAAAGGRGEAFLGGQIGRRS